MRSPLLALLLAAAPAWGQQPPLPTVELGAGMHLIRAEVADSFSSRMQGLMRRTSLPPNGGMLFVFEEDGTHCMWMKNTLIPLDMVFISPDGRVHRIESDTEPFSTALIPSEGTIAAVLELNAGQADKIGLKRGDKVVYPELANGKGP